MKRDIIITLPKTIAWSDYQKELTAAENGAIMNYKVRYLPDTEVGAKCFLLYDEYIRGFMYICGLNHGAFKCSTTGKDWDGNFIQRTGKFHYLKEPIPMKGFRNFKYY